MEAAERGRGPATEGGARGLETAFGVGAGIGNDGRRPPDRSWSALEGENISGLGSCNLDLAGERG